MYRARGPRRSYFFCRLENNIRDFAMRRRALWFKIWNFEYIYFSHNHIIRFNWTLVLRWVIEGECELNESNEKACILSIKSSVDCISTLPCKLNRQYKYLECYKLYSFVRIYVLSNIWNSRRGETPVKWWTKAVFVDYLLDFLLELCPIC